MRNCGYSYESCPVSMTEESTQGPLVALDSGLLMMSASLFGVRGTVFTDSVTQYFDYFF